MIFALFAWHLKTSESLVQEIAKKEAFIRKNVVRDFVHCVCVSYAFLFLVPTKLDDMDESPKMWRRVLAKNARRGTVHRVGRFVRNRGDKFERAVYV